MTGAGVDWIVALDERVLAAHQRAMLRASLTNRLSLHVGARQIGKSFALSALASMIATYGHEGPAHDVLIISARDKTAANLIRATREHLAALAIVHHNVENPRYPGLERIALSNGRYIQAHPGPEALQGFTGTVIADEWSLLADRHDPEEVLAQILSVSSARPYFRAVLASNADHAGSWLHRLLTDDAEAERRAEFATTMTTIHDAYPDGLPPHIERLRRVMLPREWSRWYDCEFLPPDGAGPFSRAAIAASAQAFTKPANAVRILSIDPGFTRDATGWVLIDAGDGRIDVRDAGHDYGGEDSVVAMVREACDKGGVRRVYLDPGGPGFLLFRSLADAGLPVVPAPLTDRARDEGIRRLERMVANGRIRCANQTLIGDLVAIQRDGDAFALPRLSSPIRGRAIHCDAAAALLGAMTAPETAAASLPWVNLAPVRHTMRFRHA